MMPTTAWDGEALLRVANGLGSVYTSFKYSDWLTPLGISRLNLAQQVGACGSVNSIIERIRRCVDHVAYYVYLIARSNLSIDVDVVVVIVCYAVCLIDKEQALIASGQIPIADAGVGHTDCSACAALAAEIASNGYHAHYVAEECVPIRVFGSSASSLCPLSVDSAARVKVVTSSVSAAPAPICFLSVGTKPSSAVGHLWIADNCASSSGSSTQLVGDDGADLRIYST